jgi:hypothetical protein
MPPMPVSVRASIWLLIGTYALGMVVALFDRRPLPRFPGDEDHFVFAAALAGTALIAILVGALYLFIVREMTRGKNWARLTLSILLVSEAF